MLTDFTSLLFCVEMEQIRYILGDMYLIHVVHQSFLVIAARNSGGKFESEEEQMLSITFLAAHVTTTRSYVWTEVHVRLHCLSRNVHIYAVATA